MSELLMYSRTKFCPFVNTAKMVLDQHQLSYRELLIDEDTLAYQKVLAWTGFESVPTLIITHIGGLDPLEAPSYLEAGASPRGLDRGYMITEPSAAQLEAWLKKHGLIA